MSNELTPEVDGFINRILPPAKKELQYIKDHDWSEIANVGSRENTYEVQQLITDRNIKSAVDLYKMAGEDVKKKRVQSSLQVFIEFFTILNDRYEKMVKRFDWTSFDLTNDKEAEKAKAEVSFQSALLKEVNRYESVLRGINFGGEDNKVNIRFFDDKPAPFLMKGSLEEVYPEIKDFLKKIEKTK